VTAVAGHPIEVPVPRSVGAYYAVPTIDGSASSGSLVAAGVGHVEESLPRPLPQPLVQVHRVDELPPLPTEQLAAAGATDEQLGRVRGATHVVLVSVGGRPGWPPAHEWIARSLAAGAAQRLGADIVDLIAGQVLDPTAARTSLPDSEGLVCLADWVGVEVWPEPTGYSCTTSGLRRFGLPELQSLATPAQLVDAWGRAMVGIAWRLLALWRDALPPHGPLPELVTVPALLTVTDTDVIEAHTAMTGAGGPRPGRASYAAAGAAAAAVTVRLVAAAAAQPDPAGPYLAIHPPADRAAGSSADWPSMGRFLSDACEVLFGQSGLAPRPMADPTLEQAIATARAGLADVRDRYANGGFAADPGRGIGRRRLLVRYALATDEAIEYAWAYVTSWRDPFRILATSATDSVNLPRLRAGRPVVLDAAAIVDWAVEQEGLGIVEGAFTLSTA
jgi:hypothetical protein